jgi:hypothetical protein
MIDLAWLEKETRRVLESNRVRQRRTWNGDRQVTYHAPALRPIPPWPRRLVWYLLQPWQAGYPHQWFWDSVAHAIVLSHLDSGLAREEIRSLLYAQTDEGFIPHLIWNPAYCHWVDQLLRRFVLFPHFSPYLQPPCLAEGVEAIYQKTADISFLKEVLPSLRKYYNYLERERSPLGDGLLVIISSYESGKDRSREYDPIYGFPRRNRPWGPPTRLMFHHRRLGWDLRRIFQNGSFFVQDLLFNCVYARNLRAIAGLCQAAGEEEEAQAYALRSQGTEKAILEKLMDPATGLFFSRDARKSALLQVPTISSLFPLLLETIPRGMVERLVEHLLQAFWPAFPVPADPLDDQGEDFLWRGPQTWVVSNWYVVQGLRLQAHRFGEKRYLEIADALVQRTYELVRGEGFREFYHSRAGRGMRARNFSMSTLVLDMASTPG